MHNSSPMAGQNFFWGLLKGLNLCIFTHTKNVFMKEPSLISWNKLKVFTGHISPAGRNLCMPVVNHGHGRSPVINYYKDLWVRAFHWKWCLKSYKELEFHSTCRTWIDPLEFMLNFAVSLINASSVLILENLISSSSSHSYDKLGQSEQPVMEWKSG